jgi:predicted DNA-binding protein (MmcQ/YjbR family)
MVRGVPREVTKGSSMAGRVPFEPVTKAAYTAWMRWAVRGKRRAVLLCSGKKPMSKRSPSSNAVLKELRAFGLTYPGAETKSPWPGHDDLAVNGKTFAYLSLEGEPFSISLKLPYTGEEARKLRFATPTGYGLGKSGWVTFEPTPSQMPSIRQLKSWLDESYRAQAPKKLAALVKHKF